MQPLLLSFALLFLPISTLLAAPPLTAGAARIDITPTFPVMLSGYAVRTNPSTEVEQKIWAKAIAFGSDADRPSLLISVENCGINAAIIDTVAARLSARTGLARECLSICSTHTHYTPCVAGTLENILARKFTAGEKSAIDRYTADLTQKLETVARAALRARRQARVSWSSGTVGFAKNRRTPGGPVDHNVPVLAVRDNSGKIIAILATYACHCTTIAPELNRTCGDWAGFAQEEIERAFPGAIALITIGCGADSNPLPRRGPDGGMPLSRQYGSELATEVIRVLKGPMKPVTQNPVSQRRVIELPYQPAFTRAQWEERARESGIVGFHAQGYLDRLNRGEKIPTTLSYPLHTLRFGETLAFVFLPGEVVVDYALRLKKELDPERLWIIAYANDVPCYIPSKRILSEGGYEAETSLWYYDRPQKLAPETEDLIVAGVRALLPASFQIRDNADLPARSPKESLAAAPSGR